jgi:tetratricopeptide (TPR) repeat protein
MNDDALSIGYAIGWIVVIVLILVAFFIIIKRSDHPGKLASRLIITPLIIWLEVSFVKYAANKDPYTAAFSIAISVLVASLVLAIMWAYPLIETLFSPLLSAFDGGNIPIEKKPQYSAIIAKRKSGRYVEAIAALREQLDQFPHDSEGIFLLAAIQAENMNDLPGAEITLNRFCNDPKTAPKQIAAAYNYLADWHLRINQDVAAACAAWQQIIDQFPGSDLALTAENRIAHAAESAQHLIASHDRQPIALPEGIQNLGLKKTGTFQAPEEVPPVQRADACVKHLALYPNDTEAREQLALIYAKEFNRLDLATLELRQLISDPSHQPKQIARWLNLLATLQINAGTPETTVRETLKLIVTSFPKTPLALIAARRLEQLPNEYRRLKQTPSLKLGVTDQN